MRKKTMHWTMQNLNLKKVRGTIDPFVSNAPLLYPLKTSENRKVFCFQGVEKGCIGNKWVIGAFVLLGISIYVLSDFRLYFERFHITGILLKKENLFAWPTARISLPILCLIQHLLMEKCFKGEMNISKKCYLSRCIPQYHLAQNSLIFRVSLLSKNRKQHTQHTPSFKKHYLGYHCYTKTRWPNQTLLHFS